MPPTFEQLFGTLPRAGASAPGRVNLIGEHTDYNDGLVLPAAIPLRTYVEVSPRDDEIVRAWSVEFAAPEPAVFALHPDAPAGDWADYVRALARVLADRGVSCGFDARIQSEIPPGSGLSSSAALLVALGRALRAAFDLAIEDLELARLAHTAETEFVGAPVGIMDQMACSIGEPGAALFIDTRSLAFERIALPSSAALLVVDSGIRHRHAGGEYRRRREECRRAAAALGVPTLRDVDVADLDRVARLPDPLGRRARHVVTENARVVSTVAALRAGDVAEAGRLFLASHASMRDDFDVSRPEIDALVARAAAIDGVYGARLTGGGFGGSIVALVEPAGVDRAARLIVSPAARSSEVRVVLPTAEPDTLDV